jgi:hypothetical protein
LEIERAGVPPEWRPCRRLTDCRLRHSCDRSHQQRRPLVHRAACRKPLTASLHSSPCTIAHSSSVVSTSTFGPSIPLGGMVAARRPHATLSNDKSRADLEEAGPCTAAGIASSGGRGARHPRPPARHWAAERRHPSRLHHGPPPAYAHGREAVGGAEGGMHACMHGRTQVHPGVVRGARAAAGL